MCDLFAMLQQRYEDFSSEILILSFCVYVFTLYLFLLCLFSYSGLILVLTRSLVCSYLGDLGLRRIEFAEPQSPTGPRKLFKEVTAAHVGCHCSGFPGSFLSGTLVSYGASAVTRTSGRGHVAEA